MTLAPNSAGAVAHLLNRVHDKRPPPSAYSRAWLASGVSCAAYLDTSVWYTHATSSTCAICLVLGRTRDHTSVRKSA